jgi:hypothetical protein
VVRAPRVWLGSFDLMLAEADYFQLVLGTVSQHVLNESTASYWLRRADDLEAAMHLPGDYPGRRSAEQIEASDQALAAKALACRRRASLCELKHASETGEVA